MNIHDIKNRMNDMANAEYSDPESDHGKADDLLIELVSLLAHRLDEETIRDVKEIAISYEAIEKWFA